MCCVEHFHMYASHHRPHFNECYVWLTQHDDVTTYMCVHPEDTKAQSTVSHIHHLSCHYIPRICVMHMRYAVIKPKPWNLMLARPLLTLLINFCCYTTLLSLFPSYAERHRSAGILIPNSGSPQMQFQAERLRQGIERIKSLREDLSTAGLFESSLHQHNWHWIMDFAVWWQRDSNKSVFML